MVSFKAISNWYTCLDIMPQQEGRLPIYLIRDVQYIVIYILVKTSNRTLYIHEYNWF